MMNSLISSNAGATALTDVYHQRMDDACCDVVDKGIMVQNSYNTVCAIEYLKSHNVDPRVIERVLLHPELRRKQRH